MRMKLLAVVASLAVAGVSSAAPPEDASLPLVRVPADTAAKPLVAPPRSIYDGALDAAIDKWKQDPLKHIEGDMSSALGGLADLKTDQPVQQPQARAVTRLDTVIKLLEAQCKSGSGGGGGGNKPLQDSVISKRAAGMGDMHDPKAGDQQWASLPPKQREQILQSRTEGFPPGFESILRSYYERLAQEQVADTSTVAPTVTAPAPTPDGAKQ
jgi:hypothetical protein